MFKNCINYSESILLEGLVKIILGFFLHFFHTILLPTPMSMPPPWLLRRMKWRTHQSLLSPNPRKRNFFPRRSRWAVILKKQLAVEVFPKRKQSFPKEDPKEAGNRSVSKKKRTLYPRTSQSAVKLKKLLAGRAAVPRKNSKHYTRKIRMDIFLVGYFPSQPISNTSIKTNSKEKTLPPPLRSYAISLLPEFPSGFLVF